MRAKPQNNHKIGTANISKKDMKYIRANAPK